MFSSVSLRIVIVTSSFFPNSGGLETAVLGLSKEFRNHGHRVTIVASRWPKNLPTHECVQGIPVLRLPFRLPTISRPWSLITFFVRYIQCMHAMLTNDSIRKADIVNLHYPTENALYAIRLSRALGVPLVTSLHGSEIERFAASRKANSVVIARALNLSIAIITNSHALMRKVVTLYRNETGAKGKVIWNGTVLPPAWQIQKVVSDNFILGVGRLEYIKGFDVVIRAFQSIHFMVPDLSLVIVGEGAERKKLTRLIMELELESVVRLVGAVDHHRIWDYYRNCTLFVLPSRMEAFGIAALEAMACGRAVIASDVGGVSEVIVNNITGLLFEADHVPALVSAISRLLNDPELRKEVGKRGEERAKKLFTWKRSGEQYLTVFNSAIAQL